MGSRQSFATPHSRVPGAMIGQYTLKPDTHSIRERDTDTVVGTPVAVLGRYYAVRRVMTPFYKFS